ncbi:polyubiqutin 1 [Tanacetum coccineum]
MVSPVEIHPINSSADEEGGTTVVGCDQNDASIRKEMQKRETVKYVGAKKTTRSIRKDSTSQDSQSKENVSVLPQIVNTLTEKPVSVEVKSSDTIGDVKVKITDMVGVPPCNQNFFFVGQKLLDDDRTLDDYHILSDSTLFLVPVLVGIMTNVANCLLVKWTNVQYARGRMKIYLETVGENTIPLDVVSQYTIGEVKSLIQDKEGILTCKQTLVYAGQKFDDSRTLVNYLIQNEATLRLVDNTLKRTEPTRIHEDTPYEQQRLFLPQIQLRDDCTLADYYIQNDSTLHLVVTLIKIFIKTTHRDIIALDVIMCSNIFNDAMAAFVSRIKQVLSKKKEEDISFIANMEVPTLHNVNQYKVNVPDKLSKINFIKNNILDLKAEVGQTIIFVHTKESASMLCEALEVNKFKFITLDGCDTQEQRDKIFKEFEEKRFQVLISTEILDLVFDQLQVGLVVFCDLSIILGSSSEPDLEQYSRCIS